MSRSTLFTDKLGKKIVWNKQQEKEKMSKRETTGFGAQPNQTSLKLEATAWKEVWK